MKQEPPTYLSTLQAADLLGTAPRAVLDWLRAGKFEGAFRRLGGAGREGGDWRIPLASIEAFKAGEPPADDH